MTVEDDAVVDDQIAAWSCAPAAVLVLSGLDADRIVAYIKAGVDHKHILARIHIQTVTVLRIPRVTYGDIIDYHVLAHQRMDIPAWRVLEKAVFEKDILTFLETYHHRTQICLHAVPFLFSGKALRDIERVADNRSPV